MTIEIWDGDISNVKTNVDDVVATV